MAKLPIFNSRASLNTQPPSTLTDINQVKSGGQNLESLGKVGQGIASKMQNAINSTQKTTKQNELSLGAGKTLDDAVSGNEPIEFYQDQLEELRTKAGEGFTDNTALASFRPEIDRSINTATSKLNGIFRKKLFDQKGAARILQTEITREGHLREGDFDKRKEIAKKEIEQIKTDLAEGFYKSESDAAKDIVKVNKWEENRAKTLKAQDVMVQRQLKLNRINNELDLVNDIKVNGLAGISVSSILTRAASDEDDSVRTDFANAVVGAITNTNIYRDSKLENPDFNNRIENILKLKDKEAVNTLLIEALTQSGKVSEDEMNIIIGVAISKSGTLKGLDTDSGNVAQSDKFTFLDGLKFFFTQGGKKKAEEGAKEIGEFGKREDGTFKGDGFLGVLDRPDGQVSTEISIGVNVDGKEIEIPTLVPTLTKKEIDFLLEGNSPTQTIVDKAIRHARPRIDRGRSPFKDKKDTTKIKIVGGQGRSRGEIQSNRSEQIRTYVERVESGIAPEVALENIQRENRLKEFPVMKGFPKEGILRTDENGITRRLFPTGEIRPE